LIEAIIPVRAGSRRLKDKNLANFGGTTLLAHKIRQLQRTPTVSSIVVSSDSDQMLQIAVDEGVIPLRRSPEFADDVRGKSLSETIKHIATQASGKHLMWAQVTSPLVDEEIYGRAIQLYFDGLSKGFDSLITQTVVREFLWDESGPTNYVAGPSHVPSQDLNSITKMTFGVLIAARQRMIEWAYYHGPKPYRMMLGKRESADIDDLLDLEAARSWLHVDKSQPAEILPYDSSDQTPG
jgi:CMP-N-acetylneuraminic acid synthetase